MLFTYRLVIGWILYTPLLPHSRIWKEGWSRQIDPSLPERKRAGCPHRELLAEIPLPR